MRKPKEKDITQRRELLHINCKRKGKVCKVVKDSGSTDNMVSREMVDKLNLEIIPHQTPYKASCMSDNQSLLVDE